MNLIELALVLRVAGAEIRYLDPEAQMAFSQPTRAELGSIGVNIHQLPSNVALNLARDAGFQFTRADLLWTSVERHGLYRFSYYDAVLNAFEERGMGVLWILEHGHPDHGGTVPRTVEDIAAFARFAGAAAAHFKGHNVRYEIWNEPDLEQFWPPRPNAEEYASLLREALGAIHKADPAAQVVSGGVSRFDLAFLRRAISQDLAAGLTAISVHPYPRDRPETIAPDLARLREWSRSSFGERLEIWDTEWGYSSAAAPEGVTGNGHGNAGRLRQACLAAREILTFWTAGFPLGVWYDLQDDGADATDPEQNYGLLDVSGNEKPAMQAMRTVLGAAKGRRYAGTIQDEHAGTHLARFEGSADVLFVVWNDQPRTRRKIRYTTNNLLFMTDLIGNAIGSKAQVSREAEVVIDESTGPIYLLWKRMPAISH